MPQKKGSYEQTPGKFGASRQHDRRLANYGRETLDERREATRGIQWAVDSVCKFNSVASLAVWLLSIVRLRCG